MLRRRGGGEDHMFLPLPSSRSGGVVPGGGARREFIVNRRNRSGLVPLPTSLTSSAGDMGGRGRGGVGKWTCAICGKRLSSKRSQREHMNTHTKSRPFACSHCTYAAASQMTLRRHVLRNHTPREVWGYKCPYCKESYMEPASYQHHIMTKHFGRSGTFGCPDGLCGFQTLCARHFKEHMWKHEEKKRQQVSVHSTSYTITFPSAHRSNGVSGTDLEQTMVPEPDGKDEEIYDEIEKKISDLKKYLVDDELGNGWGKSPLPPPPTYIPRPNPNAGTYPFLPTKRSFMPIPTAGSGPKKFSSAQPIRNHSLYAADEDSDTEEQTSAVSSIQSGLLGNRRVITPSDRPVVIRNPYGNGRQHLIRSISSMRSTIPSSLQASVWGQSKIIGPSGIKKPLLAPPPNSLLIRRRKILHPSEISTGSRPIPKVPSDGATAAASSSRPPPPLRRYPKLSRPEIPTEIGSRTATLNRFPVAPTRYGRTIPESKKRTADETVCSLSTISQDEQDVTVSSNSNSTDNNLPYTTSSDSSSYEIDCSVSTIPVGDLIDVQEIEVSENTEVGVDGMATKMRDGQVDFDLD